MEQERPLKERIWEFTKDLSVKVSKKAEKHWKINTLRVEIASIRHRINVKYRELGRYVFDAFKERTGDSADYQMGRDEIIEELQRLEADIAEREERIHELEQEDLELAPEDEPITPPPPPAPPPVMRAEEPEAEPAHEEGAEPVESKASTDAEPEEKETEASGEEEPKQASSDEEPKQAASTGPTSESTGS